MLPLVNVVAVPVKRLAAAKRRLSPILSPSERAALTLAMLEDVLAACAAQPGWQTWVVSGAPEALPVAQRFGARPVEDHGRSLLQAIHQVEGMVRGRSSRLAVLLADLPTLSAPSLRQALSVAEGDGGGVVAAPAASDRGTNLLVRRPTTAIPARFGRSSFARHRAEARARGVPFLEVVVPELAFDLDRPEDLATLIGSDSTRASRSRAACLEMGLAARLQVPA
jgi:2-phospho-L-lactate/phosphoenolpyruvate guanylyltransferase